MNEIWYCVECLLNKWAYRHKIIDLPYNYNDSTMLVECECDEYVMSMCLSERNYICEIEFCIHKTTATKSRKVQFNLPHNITDIILIMFNASRFLCQRILCSLRFSRMIFGRCTKELHAKQWQLYGRTHRRHFLV